MRQMIRFSILVLLLAGGVLLPGCGYHVGSLTHPQLKTVAIADVKNETYEVLGSALLRNILAERFQFDNSLKLAPLDRADCIVYARILSIDNSSIKVRNNGTQKDYFPNECRMRITVEFTVRMPGQARPLVRNTHVTEACVYQFTHDPAIGRTNAMKQCFLRIANYIVSSTTEAW